MDLPKCACLLKRLSEFLTARKFINTHTPSNFRQWYPSYTILSIDIVVQAIQATNLTGISQLESNGQRFESPDKKKRSLLASFTFNWWRIGDSNP